jgi:hypothetical protein
MVLADPASVFDFPTLSLDYSRPGSHHRLPARR